MCHHHQASRAKHPGSAVKAGALTSAEACVLTGFAGIPQYDPCIDDEVSTYFNRPEVQQALHANTSGSLPGPWMQCSPYIKYSM